MDSVRAAVAHETAFRHAPLGIALTTESGVLLHVNDTLCELLGYSEQTLLERPLARGARPHGAPAPGNSSPLPVAGSATGTHCGSTNSAPALRPISSRAPW